MSQLTINNKQPVPRSLSEVGSTIKFDLKDRSYRFSLEIIGFVDKLPQERVFIPVGDQLLRASTSVGSNIVEANSSSSEKEFIKYYEIALKSANKAEYWLSLLRDSYKELGKDTESLISEIGGIMALIESSLGTIKRRKN